MSDCTSLGPKHTTLPALPHMRDTFHTMNMASVQPYSQVQAHQRCPWVGRCHMTYTHTDWMAQGCAAAWGVNGGQVSVPRNSPGNSQGNPVQSAIMDFIELEVWSHLKQEITRRLILESTSQGCSSLAKVVLDTVIAQFAGLAPIQS